MSPLLRGEQPEVTSPLKTRPGTEEERRNINRGSSRPGGIIDLTSDEGQIPQHAQQAQQGHPSVWRVKKTESNLYRGTLQGGVSVYSGSSGGNSAGSGTKRKNGASGSGRKGKKAAQLSAAAANCNRISSFFKPHSAQPSNCRR